MSKKRFIWQKVGRRIVCAAVPESMPVAALAEEPDGSEDALRNTAVEKGRYRDYRKHD